MKTITITAVTSAIVLPGLISGIIILQNNQYNHEPLIGENDCLVLLCGEFS